MPVGLELGYERKAWGPDNISAGGRTEPLAGLEFEDGFSSFLEKRPGDRLFAYWFGTSDSHRDCDPALCEEMGIDPGEVEVPPYLPDVDTAPNYVRKRSRQEDGWPCSSNSASGAAQFAPRSTKAQSASPARGRISAVASVQTTA